MRIIPAGLVLASFLIFGSFHEGQCQSVIAGVKGGISIPNLTSTSSNPLNNGYMSGLGPDLAIFGEYEVSDLFSLELSAEYSAQGGKKNGKQAVPNPLSQTPPYLYANFNAEARLNYLLIPLLAKFGLDLDQQGKWRIYGDAGPFVGFLLSARTITSGTSNVYNDEAETDSLLSGPISFAADTTIKDQLNTFNYGIAANIGLAYQFNQHKIFLEVGGNYGFKIIQKDPADGQNRAGAAVIRIGYAYRFGNNGKNSKNAKAVRSPEVFK
ncbi:MAG: porin family protein [Chitinophagales bacterium]